MDAPFNDNEVLNSIEVILAERRTIRQKLMTAVEELREVADRSASGVKLPEGTLWQRLCATNNHTSGGNDDCIAG